MIFITMLRHRAALVALGLTGLFGWKGKNHNWSFLFGGLAGDGRTA
ncbi:MAG: hypothetical protein WKF84_22730 [Pyrinomonadaceae bacterium]